MSRNLLQNAKRKRPLHDSDDDLPAIHLKPETPAGPEAWQESEYGTDSEVCAISLMMLSVGLTVADLPLPSYASEYTKNSVRQKQTCWTGLIKLLLKEFSGETQETRQGEAQRLRQSFIRKAESLSEAQSVISSGSSLAHVTNSQMEIPLDGVDPDATEPEDDIWDDSDGGESVDATEPYLQSESGPQVESERRTETGDILANAVKGRIAQEADNSVTGLTAVANATFRVVVSSAEKYSIGAYRKNKTKKPLR